MWRHEKRLQHRAERTKGKKIVKNKKEQNLGRMRHQADLRNQHVTAGVSVGTRSEEAGVWMTSLLGLLPSPVGASAKAPPPPDTPEALQYIAVLQCLQRLVSAPALAGVMLSTTGTHAPPTLPLRPTHIVLVQATGRLDIESELV